MLTLYTMPKAFRGHINVIQRNAIQSWMRLTPACEILLLGDDPGTAETAAEFGLRHLSDIARNEYGTPLISDIFGQAEAAAAHPLVCYINADIILGDDFLEAVQRVSETRTRFLMVGQRWDADITQPWDFDRPDWQDELTQFVRAHGTLHGVTGMDYFLYPQGLFGTIPPFAIGRTVWDNWFLYQARSRGGALIDATQAVFAVHQNHDYSHVPSAAGDAWRGPEAKKNLEMAGGPEHIFTLTDATAELIPQENGLLLRRRRSRRHLQTLPILYPSLAPLFWAGRLPGRVGRRLRRGLKPPPSKERSLE